jgi:hypothetical protein
MQKGDEQDGIKATKKKRKKTVNLEEAREPARKRASKQRQSQTQDRKYAMPQVDRLTDNGAWSACPRTGPSE